MKDRLSPRDLELLVAYARLGSIKEAAYSIGMSPNTAKGHLASSFTVLEASTFIDALRALGWLVVPEIPNPHEDQ